jgi:hypothetical protein
MRTENGPHGTECTEAKLHTFLMFSEMSIEETAASK